MAGASLFTLLDDITSLLDDIAGMTKAAAGKTAGVVGDDMALNAQQVLGTPAQRELPIVWAVARGSLVNKLILIPAAIALSAFAPFLITPLLMLGGLYLCFEGAEKVLHPHHEKPEKKDHLDEAAKIKGAIRTDFILSAEIIIIVLGVVAGAELATRIATMAAIGLGMTVLVYGLVAAIVKLDDLGIYLSSRPSAFAKHSGALILKSAPSWLMRALGILGTAAMFLVGGQILLHGIPPLHHAIEPHAHGLLALLVNGVFGFACGALAVGAFTLVRKIIPAK
jgi:predicted DNA repair protein MutK